MIMFNANQLCFSELRDYCERETFHAYCSNSKVVLMQEAIYGRMELGTCLTVDLGFMGCFRWVYAIQLYWRYRIIMNCITTYNHVITIGMAFAVTCYLTWTNIALVVCLVRYQWHGWWFWRILAQTMWGVIYKQVIPVYLVSFYADILCKHNKKNSPINMLQIQIKKIDAYICGIKRFYDNSMLVFTWEMYCIIAKYSCIIQLIAVIQHVGSCCQTPDDRAFVAVGSGSLASSVALDTGCGKRECPWELQALEGERINISIYDFGLC